MCPYILFLTCLQRDRNLNPLPASELNVAIKPKLPPRVTGVWKQLGTQLNEQLCGVTVMTASFKGELILNISHIWRDPASSHFLYVPLQPSSPPPVLQTALIDVTEEEQPLPASESKGNMNV